MNSSRNRTSERPAVLGGGVALLAVGGVCAALLSSRFDGFAQGLFIGAGLLFIVAGAALLSGVVRARFAGDPSDDGEDMWLPSDGEPK